SMLAAELTGLDHGGDRSKGSNEPLLSNEDAAAALSVSKESVKRARKVKEKAIPPLKDAVLAGDVSISSAAIVAEQPRKKQNQLNKRGPKAIEKFANDHKQLAKGGLAAEAMKDNANGLT